MSATYSINQNTIQEAVSFTSITDVLNLLPDNTQKSISPRDARDAVFSVWENSVFRYTTIGAYEYIGLNREDVKSKIYFGKKQLSNLNIMNNTLLSSDTDIFFYNTKTDTNPSQDLKISFLGGTTSTLYQYSPYLKVNQVYGTSSVMLDINIINPGPNGGDINLSSSNGRLSIQNQLIFPTEAEILSTVTGSASTSSSNDLFLVREITGRVGFKKIKVDYVNIGDPFTPINIQGNPVQLNGFPLDFTELTPTVATVGGIGIGITFSNVPLVEMIRMIIYPELGPLASINLQYDVLERNHSGNTTISYNYSLTKRSYDIASTQRVILGYPGVNINTPDQTVSGSGLIIQNFTDSYTFSGSQIQSSDNTFTFSIIPSDGTFSYTATDVINFVYPYFYGFSNTLATNTIDFNNIVSNDLYKNVDIKQNQNLSLYGLNEYLYFSYPASYGTISTIYDSSNFLIYEAGSTTSIWTYSTITNINSPIGYWSGIPYLVYRTINKSTIPSTEEYKFNFN